jgi:hypothetical protein
MNLEIIIAFTVPVILGVLVGIAYLSHKEK